METKGHVPTEEENRHRSAAIAYQLKQLPRNSGFPVQRWRELFSPITLPVPTYEIQENPPIDSGGSALVWKLDPHMVRCGAFVKYREYGYDKDGDLCILGQDPLHKAGFGGRTISSFSTASDATSMSDFLTEHIVLEDETTGTLNTRYGREWIFGLNGLHDSSLLSIAALQFCRDVDVAGICDSSQFDEGRRRIAKCFVTKFKAKWDQEVNRELWGTSDYRWSRSALFDKSLWEDLVFQYHMRVFTVNPTPRRPGPGLQRFVGKLHLPGKRTPYSIRPILELRYSVGLKTTWKLDKAVFTLVTMADSSLNRLRELDELSDVVEWVRAGIQPSLRGTGVGAFAFRIWSLLPHWERHWLKLLDHLDEVFATHINLEVILSPGHRRKVMIDGSALQLSEFYFGIGSTLRIAAEWIRESMDNLRSTVSDIERLYFSPRTPANYPSFLPVDTGDLEQAKETFRKTFENVIARQQSMGLDLLSRIERKQEEIKGLRDGVFNATAVHEATKSTQINHYIFVFTVVTIFYLPLSFVTALFALGFFDLQGDPRQTRWFIITTVSVALSTYVFAWLLIRVVQDPSRRQVPRRAYDWLTERIVKPKLP